MTCRVFLCKDTNLLLFFKKLRLLVLKISDVNRSILVFKFWAIKSGETLSCLSIDISSQVKSNLFKRRFGNNICIQHKLLGAFSTD